jgi:hypothetical protein
MRLTITSILVLLVIALSAAMEIVRELKIAGYLNLETQVVAAYAAFALNFAVAIVGLWTRFRLAWLSYLAISAASILLFSSLPIATAWILIKLASRHVFA